MGIGSGMHEAEWRTGLRIKRTRTSVKFMNCIGVKDEMFEGSTKKVVRKGLFFDSCFIILTFHES